MRRNQISLKGAIFFAFVFLISWAVFPFGGSRPDPGNGGGGDGGNRPDPGNGGGGGIVDSETRQWQNILKEHGGKVMNPSKYAENESGFNQYMRDSGLQDHSPLKIITPNNSSAAKRCGYSKLLPPRSEWIRGAALAMWTQRMGRVAGDTPRVRNWYRPTCYNSAVGGAKSSDHIQARAFDLDFSSSSARRKAQNWLCQYWKSSLNMQVGLGGVTIHIGALSPRGKRNWYYGSYGDSDKNRTCFDR